MIEVKRVLLVTVLCTESRDKTHFVPVRCLPPLSPLPPLPLLVALVGIEQLSTDASDGYGSYISVVERVDPLLNSIDTMCSLYEVQE